MFDLKKRIYRINNISTYRFFKFIHQQEKVDDTDAASFVVKKTAHDDLIPRRNWSVGDLHWFLSTALDLAETTSKLLRSHAKVDKDTARLSSEEDRICFLWKLREMLIIDE